MANPAPFVLQHDTSRKMLGAEWSGKQSITVNERDVPMVTDPVSRLSLTHMILWPHLDECTSGIHENASGMLLHRMVNCQSG